MSKGAVESTVIDALAVPADPLGALPELSRCDVELDRLRRDAVERARERGASWEQVGAGLRMTRQAAWEFYTRQVRADLARSTAESDRPAPTSVEYVPEPALSDVDYEDAVRIIQNAYWQLERSPTTARRMEEGERRDLLLVSLNSQFEGQAGGSPAREILVALLPVVITPKSTQP